MAIIHRNKNENSIVLSFAVDSLGGYVELSEFLLGERELKEWTREGELIPDPNLIWNIDHLASFIQMELDSWKMHCEIVDNRLAVTSEVMCSFILYEKENVRFYIKSLFDIATYYVACIQALDKLLTQLYKLSSKYYRLKVKKPKLEIDQLFHAKAQFIRDKSFIHQNSEQISNPMDKRAAMSWTPNISYKSGDKPTCENYKFGDGKWWVKVNGIKTETEIDISTNGLVEFATKAQEQIEIRKSRVVHYYNEIKENKLLEPDPVVIPVK